MAQIIGFLKIIQDGILPTHKKESITTTNFLFRLHTKYISSALIITSTLLFIQQLFAEHLKCIRPSDEGTKLESQPLNQFCYTTGTYATRNESDSFFSPNPTNLESVTQFHQYFQWVPFILFLQGLTFHFPQLLWRKYVERGKLARFCGVGVGVTQTSDSGQLGEGDEVDQKEIEPALQPMPQLPSFASTLHSAENKRYFKGFVACEILNIVMVFVSILTTQWFLGGRFILMGPRWMAYLHRLRGGRSDGIIDGTLSKTELSHFVKAVETGNPLEGAFPTTFICPWNKPMTDLTYDVPCILGENVTHQRIYVFLWFILLLLLVFGITNLIYRFRVCTNRKLRVKLVERHATKRACLNPHDLSEILIDMSVQDWFILKRILQNVNSTKFDLILSQVKEAQIQALSGGVRVQDQGSTSRPGSSNGVTTNNVIELQLINVDPS